MTVDLPAPAYKALADDLRAQITSGRLRPGDRLPTEPQLGRSSGVSRSTVREALRQLASQHLIITTRGVSGGSFVAHPTPAQLADTLATGVHLMQARSAVGLAEVLEVRGMLEISSAGLAARRRGEEHLASIRACMFDADSADLETMIVRHPGFHIAISEACGNPVLELLTRPLQTVANPRDLAATLDRDFWRQVGDDHRAIYEAVLRQEPEEAESAASRHLDHLRRTLVPAWRVPVPGGVTQASLASAGLTSGGLTPAEVVLAPVKPEPVGVF